MRSERGGNGVLFSHPCAEKLAHGWGTGLLSAGKERKAGPATALRCAQEGCR
jgi:hypothetical protein